MKRFWVLPLIALTAAIAIYGCESVSGPSPQPPIADVNGSGNMHPQIQPGRDTEASITDGGAILFSKTLPNGALLDIYDIDTAGEIIAVAYSYKADGYSGSRVLNIEKSMKYLTVFDQDGNPLSGFLHSKTEQGAAVTIFSGDNEITVSQSEMPDSPFSIGVSIDGESNIAEFSTENEFDSGATLYSLVHDYGYDPGELTPSEQALLAKVEIVASWHNSNPQNGIEFGIATQLALDSDFQEWSDAPYSPEEPMYTIPAWLDAVCGLARIVQKACHLIGDNVVCEWVDVAVAICDWIDANLR